jgi:nitrogen regulatory protein P-II 1
MKNISAIIQPQKLDRVRAAFRQIEGFPGMSVSKVECCGPDYVSAHARSIKQELTDSASKLRIEIVCTDELVEPIIDALIETNRTGKLNDGMVWVSEVLRSQRICDGAWGWGTARVED